MKRAHHITFAAALTAPFLMGAAPTVDAAWNPAGEPVATGLSTQNVPAVASDGAGGSIIAFEDRRSGNYDVYVQRIDASGVAQWTLNGVAICSATGDQRNVGIVPDGSGGAIIWWEDQRVGFPADIYAQRVNSSGVPQWTADGIGVCTVAQAQTFPVGVSDGAGGVIVAWQDRRAFNYDIYAQRLDGSGTPQWTANGVEVCGATGNQVTPQITTDGANGAWIAWTDPRAGAGNTHYYTQRVSSAGAPQYLADGLPVCVAGNSRSALTLAPDNAGGVMLAWRDNRNGLAELFVQYVTSAGAIQWMVDGLSIVSGVNNTIAVAPDPTLSEWYLAWDDIRDVGQTQIYAQRIDATGAAVWLSDTPVCTAPRNQTAPVAVTDGSGNLLVAWSDPRGPAQDFYAQRVDATGAVAWATDGVPVCAFPGDRQRLVMALGNADEMLLAWGDRRNDRSFDVYAQRIDTSAPPGQIVVDNTADSGSGSLREAILSANGTAGVDQILFAIPGPGPHVIQPVTPLPTITAPVIVEGYSQTGSSVNTALGGVAGTAVVAVRIDGSTAGGVGLDIAADGCVVRGLSIYDFSSDGVRFTGVNTGAVEGCFIGTDGVTDLGNGGHGVLATTSTDVFVGAQSFAGRNVICANAGDGVRMTDVVRVRVGGNHIGLDASAGPLGNDGAGVHVDGTSSDVQVGVTSAVPSSNLPVAFGGNAIRHNGDDGVRIVEAIAGPIQISGNGIDLNAGLGIDTAEDGVNGASVATSFAPAPVVTRAFLREDGWIEIEGTATGPPNTTVNVLLYASSACDPSGSGEGARYIVAPLCALDGSGNGSFNYVDFFPEPGVAQAHPGDVFTAVMVETGGLTSEFSACEVFLNTEPGLAVTVSAEDVATGTTADLTFDEVTGEGVTTIEVTDTAPPVPGGFEIGDPPVYYDVQTTATFTGNVEVCINYDQNAIGIPETDLVLLHYDSGTAMWQDVTTSVNTATNVICGSVSSLSPFVVATMPTMDVDVGDLPTRIAFGPASPNPMLRSTVFALELPAEEHVDVRVHDLQGRVVRTLARGTFEPGRHALRWDGTSDDGQRLEAGLYFVRAAFGGQLVTQRVIVLK